MNVILLIRLTIRQNEALIKIPMTHGDLSIWFSFCILVYAVFKVRLSSTRLSSTGVHKTDAKRLMPVRQYEFLPTLQINLLNGDLHENFSLMKGRRAVFPLQMQFGRGDVGEGRRW